MGGRAMAGDLHIRCGRCGVHLGGPLGRVESGTAGVACEGAALGLDDWLAVGAIRFPKGDLFDFAFESEDDLFLHPQWCEGWTRDWPDLAQGAATRRRFAVAKGYGCCGASGDLACRCGAALGKIVADCIGPHWAVLFDSRIERSDRIDGRWTIHADADGDGPWYEDHGELIRNRRQGEWERWLVTPQLIDIPTRDRHRAPAIARQERLDRRWVGSSQWDDGRLICEVSE